MDDRIGPLLDQILEAALTGASLDVERLVHEEIGLSDDERLEVLAFATSLSSTSGDLDQEETPARALLPGEDLGQYRIVRELGRGGQGIVFLAIDQRLRRRVALKVLDRGGLRTREGSKDSNSVTRLRREAEILARLSHPNIGIIHDLGFERGMQYLAMRFEEGATLGRHISAARDRGDEVLLPVRAANDGGPDRRTPVLRITGLIEEAARALHAAHDAGVLHRDIKPANIMVDREGSAVLLDFGLARDQTGALESLTHSERIIGTLAYMSPEQVEPRGRTLDRRADVYSLGATLFEALCLRQPFVCDSLLELARAIVDAPLPDLRQIRPDIARELSAMVARALAKEPDQRYRTAQEFAEDLARFGRGEGVRARPQGPLRRAALWVRRPMPIASMLVLVALLAVLGLVLGVVLPRMEADRELILSAQELGARPRIALQHALRAAELVAGPEADEAALQALMNLRELRHRTAHVGGASFLCSDPAKGAWLVTAGNDRKVLRWDRDRLQPTELDSSSFVVDQLLTSPDGRRLAAILRDGPVRVWETIGWISIDLPTRGATWLAFGPSGDRLLVAGHDDWARIYELGGSGISIELVDPGRIRAVAFHPQGHTVITGDQGGHVTVWDALTGDRRYGWDAHDSSIGCLVYSPRDTVIASCADGDGATLWAADGESEIRQIRQIRRIRPTATYVSSLLFHPDGEHIYSMEGSAIRRHTVTGGAVDQVFEFGANLSILSLGNRRERLVVGLVDGRLALLDEESLAGEELLLGHSSGVQGAALHDGTVFSVALDGDLIEWQVRSPVLVASSGAQVRTANVDPSGHFLVTAGGSTPRLYDADTLVEIGGIDPHDGALRSAQFGPAGRRFVTASMDGTARIWNVDPLEEIGILPHRGDSRDDVEVWFASFSPDGDRIVTASNDRVARVWDIARQEVVLELPGHAGGVRSACFSQDGELIATSSEEDGAVRLWDARSGEARLAPMIVQGDKPTVASFWPSRPRIVVGYRSGALRIWNTDSGELVHEQIEAHESDINTAVANSDGTLIVTASNDHTARLWDAGTWKLRLTLRGHKGGVHHAAFHPTQASVITASADGSVRIWPIDPVAEGRKRLAELQR